MPAAPFCSPQPGSTFHIKVAEKEKCVPVYLCTQVIKTALDRPELPTVLQCWTNLPGVDHTGEPEDEDEEAKWYAVDLGYWPPQNDGDDGLQFTALEVPVARLEAAARKGRTLSYSLTWRLSIARERSEIEIRWLYLPEQNASLVFHLPHQRDPLEDLIAGICVTGSAYIDLKRIERGKEGVALLPIRLDLGEDGRGIVKIFEPVHDASGGAVWERTKSTWHTSRCFNTFEDISDQHNASLIILQYRDVDRVVIFFPMCNEATSVNLRRCGRAIHANVDQIDPHSEQGDQVIIAIGPTSELHSLIRKCFARLQASTVTSSSASLPRQVDDDAPYPALAREDGPGFCTWEALGAGRERPFLSRLCDVLERFERQTQVAISTLLIDDGWQDVSSGDTHARELLSFDMDRNLLQGSHDSHDIGETSTLCRYLNVIRSRFAHLRYVGVWITLAGYWGGVDYKCFADDFGPLLKANFCNPFWSQERNRLQTWYLPAVNRLESFYGIYFSFLKAAGVSFVKIDDQSDWEWISSLTTPDEKAIPMSPSTYFDQAWTAMMRMAEEHFGPESVIHCMAFGHRFLTRLAMHDRSYARIHFRNSDDTFPQVPSAHVWHVYHNALNACLSSGNAMIIPDADMITSYMPCDTEKVDWAEYHAAFRACFSTSKI
ncbi:hypothetical protein CBS101457_004629 [Exobasidium rhododendri]|nr:hypothetical protein CBS101457_004629 [Exobasidium rhododendri]